MADKSPRGSAAATLQLAKDPVLWLVIVVVAGISAPYFLPFLDPQAVTVFGNRYAGIPLYAAVLACVGWGIRALPDPVERRFWGLIALAMFFNLVVPFLYLSPVFRSVRGDLQVDMVYLLFYLLLILAQRLRPDRVDTVVATPPDRVESLATLVFLCGLLAYFVVVPEAVDPGSNRTWIPSMVFYWIVDLYLVVGFVYLHQTSTHGAWRVTYAWMAIVALGWATTDALETLEYAGWIRPVPGTAPLNALWYMPYLALGVAARARTRGWPSVLDRLGRRPEERARPVGRMGVVVLYAMVLPVLHSTSELTGLLDESSRDAREVTVLVVLALLLGLAFVHQRLVETRAQGLEEARRSLEEQQALLSAAVEQSVDAVMVVDLEGLVAYANPAWERVGGSVAGHLVGRRAEEAIQELGDDALALVRSPPQQGLGSARISRRTRGGQDIEEDLSISPVRNRRGELTHYTVFLRDVTKETKLERQLQQAQRMESLGTLAGGIAHDFNNMLAAILGYSELLQDSLGEDSTLYGDVEEIVRAAERAKSLTAQILTFSRQQEAERRPVYLGTVVGDALKLVRPTIPSTITVEARVESGQGRVLAEESRIHQVVLNLLTNAVQAVGEKGTLTITVEEGAQVWSASGVQLTSELPDGDYAVLSVSDDGPGMDSETVARMYDPFFTTKELGLGTGLGLSVVHGIVTGQGGGIAVESEQGRGTTFRVYLPLDAGEAGHAEGDDADPPRATSTAHLLLVDDEKMVAEVLSRGLERAGFRITVAQDPRRALDSFLAVPASFDALITDQTMPGLTGMELAEEVHRIRPDLPVLLLTGYSDSVTPERMKAAGLAEVIYKPVNRADLVAAIRQHLDAAPGDPPTT